MLLLDDRIGSRHYQALIQGSHLTRLEAGDAMWSAADGRLVGVEIKKVLDAVNCMFSGRLADHQIPLMVQLYDVRYLVIEGTYRPEPGTGVLQLWRLFDSAKEVKCGRWYDASSGRKRLMYSAFESWLTTVGTISGTSVRNTPCTNTTAALLCALYNWWQRTDHKSFNTMHNLQGNGAELSRPTMFRRMLSHLPHVGWDRSAELSKRVRAVQFVGARKVMRGADWHIEGQIAEKSAADIDEACDG